VGLEKGKMTKKMMASHARAGITSATLASRGELLRSIVDVNLSKPVFDTRYSTVFLSTPQTQLIQLPISFFLPTTQHSGHPHRAAAALEAISR
jgi:hypothetical protein